MPKHRVTEYISKDVVREIHEKPRNSLLALSQRTGWEKNEDDDDGVPPPGFFFFLSFFFFFFT